MMKIFLDVEFTKLEPGNKPISIALVDENEHFFYAELTDTYRLEDCSDFVKDFVLPFLKGGNYRMTEYQCKLAMAKWIEDHEQRCIITSDAPSWDLPHLNRFLEPLWPENLEKELIVPISVPFDVEERIVTEFDYDIHNALDDALVMKKAIVGK